MRSNNKSLHRIKEWEERAKALPIVVEFRECLLDQGYVTKFTGTADIDGKRRELEWNSYGQCYYRGKRIKEYDITFKND